MAENTTSTYPALAASLKTSLTAALPDVTVARGAPIKTMTKDAVLIGGVEKGSHEFVVMRAGRKPRDEQYLLILNIISVRVGTTEPTDAEVRAFEMLAEVENLIANDPTIGAGISTVRMNIAEWEMDSYMEDNGGWRAVMVVKLMVKARLA